MLGLLACGNSMWSSVATVDGPVGTCLQVWVVRKATPRPTRCLSLPEQLLPVVAEEFVKALPGFRFWDAAIRGPQRLVCSRMSSTLATVGLGSGSSSGSAASRGGGMCCEGRDWSVALPLALLLPLLLEAKLEEGTSGPAAGSGACAAAGSGDALRLASMLGPHPQNIAATLPVLLQ